MTDTLVEVSPLTLIPDGDEYVGCFNDVVGDRVLTTVSTYDDLTLEVSIFCGAFGWPTLCIARSTVVS